MERYIILEIFIYNILDRVECDRMGWDGVNTSLLLLGFMDSFYHPLQMDPGEMALGQKELG